MPSLIATLGANIAPFVTSLDEAQGRAKKSGEGIGSAFGNELSGKLAGLFTVGAIEEIIRRTVEYGSKVNDLAARLGISTDAVQQWDFALKQSGSSIDAAAGFFEKLAVNRDKALKGSESQIAAFQKLGISLDQLKKSRVEDIAAVIAKGFENGDPQQLIGALREVGGKAAGELIPAFREGLAGALKTAPLISAEDIAALDRAEDSFTRMKATLTSMTAGPISEMAQKLEESAEGWKLMAAVASGYRTGGTGGAIGAAYQENLAYEDKKWAAIRRKEGEELRRSEGRGLDVDENFDAKKAQKEEDMILDAIEEDQKIQDKKAEAARKAVEASEAQAEKDAQDKTPFKRGQLQVNSLQQSGFFVGGLGAAPEIAMLDVSKKSEQHLAAIKKGIERINAQGPDQPDDVQF